MNPGKDAWIGVLVEATEGCSPYPQEKWAFMFWRGQEVIDQVQRHCRSNNRSVNDDLCNGEFTNSVRVATVNLKSSDDT